MKSLPGGCQRSDLTVSPKNWKSDKAKIKQPWRIIYRFYDPAFKGTALWGKQIPIKGMNIYHTLAQRQAITAGLLADELDLLDNQGYNPITKKFTAPAAGIDVNVLMGKASIEPAEISPDSTLMDALQEAFKIAKLEEDTRTDIRSTLKYFGLSATMLRKHSTPVKEIRKKDVESILDNCANLHVEKLVKNEKGVKELRRERKVWNANQFNHYRKYLSILFSVLEDKLEIIDSNPVEKIPKQEPEVEADPTEQKKKILTVGQRIAVNEHIAETDPDFRRFLDIFFHSGARRSEMMKVQGKHVDLQGQRFRVLIKKRKKKAWVWKTIKDIALPLWAEALAGCGPEDFVFSKGLVPGPKSINPKQITRRWLLHVKKKLGLDVNFYWLKHTHTSEMNDILIDFEMAEQAAVEETAEHNSHTSGAMVVSIYDVKRDKRKHNRVKAVNNSFAGK